MDGRSESIAGEGPGTEMSDRRVLRTPFASQSGVPERLLMPKLRGWDVLEITVVDLQKHLAQGHFSSAEYVTHCIDYIRVANPYLEAVIEINPEARLIAERLDEERGRGALRGPLHGIPVLIKDNIATKDLNQTTAGSWALLGSIVPEDAFVVAKLRDAGAVVLGHANMSEWACMRSRDYSEGYSARGGQVRNPYDLRMTPYGSSSGSAVAVAANLVPLALGTETDTSIIGPAAINAVVGIKPTVGLTSRSGVIPISENMDSVGPFGRTVSDAVVLLDAIAGQDERDRFTVAPGMRNPKPFISYISTKEELKGARFGLVMKGCWELAPARCKTVASKLLDSIRQAGAEIVEVDFPSVNERVSPSGDWDWRIGEPSKREATVANVDAYNGINAYLAALVETPVRSVEEVIEYNVQNTGTEGGIPGTTSAFPDGQPGLHELAETKGVKDATYYAALQHTRRQTRENGIDAALSYTDPATGEKLELDALLFCDRRSIGQMYAAQAGYPIICIPIDLDSGGLPVSLSLQHSAWKEAELVRWASAIEDLWNSENGRRPMPQYRNLQSKNIPVIWPSSV